MSALSTELNPQRENQLKGQILQIEKDRKNAKITVDIGMHDRIISVMSIEEFTKLSVKEGTRVMVDIEAKNIMLGR